MKKRNIGTKIKLNLPYTISLVDMDGNEEVYYLSKVKKTDLLFHRISSTAGLIIKESDDYYFTDMPKGLRLNIDDPQIHKCRTCAKLIASVQDPCEKVLDPDFDFLYERSVSLQEKYSFSKCIEKYDFIHSGFESFGLNPDVFIVTKCDNCNTVPLIMDKKSNLDIKPQKPTPTPPPKYEFPQLKILNVLTDLPSSVTFVASNKKHYTVSLKETSENELFAIRRIGTPILIARHFGKLYYANIPKMILDDTFSLSSVCYDCKRRKKLDCCQKLKDIICNGNFSSFANYEKYRRIEKYPFIRSGIEIIGLKNNIFVVLECLDIQA